MKIEIDPAAEMLEREYRLRDMLPGQGAWMDREGHYLRAGVLDPAGSTRESPCAKRVVLVRRKFSTMAPTIQDVDRLLGAVERRIEKLREAAPRKRRHKGAKLPQGDLFTGEFGGGA